MALKNLITQRGSYLRSFIDAHAPHLQKLAREINKRLSALPAASHPVYGAAWDYALVGAAVDYRFRALFDPGVHKSPAVLKGLLRCHLLLEMGRGDEVLVNPWRKHRGPDSVEAGFVAAYERFVASQLRLGAGLTDDAEFRLARFCYWFANIDAVSRSVTPPTFVYRHANRDVEKMLDAVPQQAVDDVVALSRSLQTRYSHLVGRAAAHIGTTLSGSRDVQGADFDLVVNGTLFELKTTIKPAITTNHLRQVIGYWLLDYEDEFGIREAVLEMPRQRHAERFVLADVVRGADQPGRLRAHFRAGMERLRGS